MQLNKEIRIIGLVIIVCKTSLLTIASQQGRCYLFNFAWSDAQILRFFTILIITK